MSTPPGLILSNLALDFAGRTVFEQLSLLIPAGKCTALLGPSGVGKTSLLRIIAGLEPPAAGSVAATDGAPLPGRIAYLAQQDLLLPWASALENVAIGAKLRREKPDFQRAAALLARTGLAGRERALPHELSGGMKSRVALARTLYEDRPIVLMDEPFSALDAITRARIQELAAELFAGRTVLLITHDPQEAARLAHHLLVLAGDPARLAPPLAMAGEPPRATDDPILLQTQGRLLRALSADTPS